MDLLTEMHTPRVGATSPQSSAVGALCFDHVVFADTPAAAGSNGEGRAGAAPRRRTAGETGGGAGVRRAPAGPSPEGREFLTWLCALREVDISLYRDSVLRRREAACLRALRARTPGQAREAVCRDQGRVDAAIGALLIGVTCFFREPEVFATLGRLLPGVLGVQETGGARVLSVGCSNGSEVYSAAILLAEAGMLQRSVVLGTDCRESAILTARAGVYPAHAVAGLEPGVRERYFRPVPGPAGGSVRVSPVLASACRWEVRDAFEARVEPRWDVVFCRNLAIYLNPGPARELWRRLCASLRPGGVLVVGKAERPTEKGLAREGACVYRKLEE